MFRTEFPFKTSQLKMVESRKLVSGVYQISTLSTAVDFGDSDRCEEGVSQMSDEE